MKSMSWVRNNKKGQVSNLAPAILALVFAGIVLVLGLVISQAMVDTQEGAVLTSTANESLAAFNGAVDTNQSLPGSLKCGYADSVASLIVYNTTLNVIVDAGNYTSYPDGNIINLTDDIAHYPWLVSYDYTWGGQACEGANDTVTGLGTFADFWEIIVLAVITTTVIGLLLAVFGGKKRSSR